MDRPSQNKSSQNYYYYAPTSAARQVPPSKQTKSSKHRGRKLLIFIIFIIIGLGYGLISNRLTIKPSLTASPIIIKKLKPISTKPNPNITTMSDTINGIISQNSDIDMSVSLINLNDDQTEHYGDSLSFTAASTTKVITATDYLKEVELGQQSLNESVDDTTAQNAIQQMIVISDDDTWDDLKDVLGNAQLQNYATSIGVGSYQTEANTVTSSDMAWLLGQLYEGKLLNNTDTQLLLSYLEQANYRQYIVPAVPAGDTIYHKTGFYEDNLDDEAIITKGDKAFVIVIFTNGNGVYDWSDRALLMQQITSAALTAYF